jgi:hypothetical protein
LTANVSPVFIVTGLSVVVNVGKRLNFSWYALVAFVGRMVVTLVVVVAKVVVVR